MNDGGARTVRKAFLRLLIVSIVLSAVLGIYALLASEFGDTELKILLTSLCVSAASVLVMSCSVATERNLLGPLPHGGSLVSIAACTLFVIGMWTEVKDDDFWKTAV